MIQGFLLGISSGGICLLYCLPVLFPFLAAEGRSTRMNYRYLAVFMSGRLGGYILFAVAAWMTGKIIINNGAIREMIFASAYIVLSVFVVMYVLSHSHRACNTAYIGRIFSGMKVKGSSFTAPVIGFLTGINLCPPFLLAFTGAAGQDGLAECIMFFVFFFAGTALYFLPVPFVGVIGNKNFKTVGIMSAVFVAGYYFIKGLVVLAGVVYL